MFIYMYNVHCMAVIHSKLLHMTCAKTDAVIFVAFRSHHQKS
jgi:hypothetical protein